MDEKKVLHLTLKKKWFDMIASGAKREEYREMKPYWNKRLLCNKTQYDRILFRNGYNKDSPSFMIEFKSLQSGLGIIEWGAPAGQPVFILKLGNIIE